DDGNAYFQLAEAYRLWENATKDRQWAPRLPELTTLRAFQRTAALNQATIGNIQPESEVVALLSLFDLYLKSNNIEAALTVNKKAMVLLRESHPQEGIKPEAFRKEIERREKDLKDLESEVNNRRNQFEVAAA